MHCAVAVYCTSHIPLPGSMPLPRLLSYLCQILVREPRGVLQSFSEVLEPTQQEMGYTVSRDGMHCESSRVPSHSLARSVGT